MKLTRVTGKLFYCTCISCGYRIRSDGAYADADGTPFQAYWCERCVQTHAPDQFDGLFTYTLPAHALRDVVDAIRRTT